jgi:hypothetical protein
MKFILEISPKEGKEEDLNLEIINFLKKCKNYNKAMGRIEEGDVTIDGGKPTG